MRKIVVRLLAGLMILCLTACSGATPSKEQQQASIAPYELTEREAELLQALGLKDRAQVMEFRAPEETLSVCVTVYRLNEQGTWDVDSAPALGFERSESGPIRDGLFAIILGENHAIEIHVSHNGSHMSSKTDEIILDIKPTASTTGFLNSAADVQLNQEIPVALLVYDSGGHMPGASVEDYFDPSDFQGMDLVQAVTLTFYDEKIDYSY